MRRQIIRLGVLAVVLAAVALIADPSRAAAHGKEVQILLRCAPPAATRPLDQRCEATVTAANDGDPVTDARLILSAVRSGKAGQFKGVPFQPTAEPGQYAVSVSLPGYGIWLFTAEVEAPAEGHVQLSEEVLPPSVGIATFGQARARLLVSFNGRDVANLAALIAHLLGTIALFSGMAAVALVGLIAHGERGIQYRRWLARWFPWAASASAALIVASGVYNALYNAPTRSPGLFHPQTIAALPFGKAYVIAFAVKMMLALALFAGTAWLAVQLRRSVSWRVPRVAGASAVALEAVPRPRAIITSVLSDSCVSLAIGNLIVGGCVLVTVLIVDYFHLLSHIGVFTGG